MERSDWGRLWKPAVVILLIAEVVGFILLESNDPKPNSSRAAATAAATQESSRVANDQAGYSIEAPEGWDATKDGVTSLFESPDGEAVLSIGPGPARSAVDVIDQLQDLVADSYSDVRVIGNRFDTFGSEPAEVIEGVATNSAGARLRFLIAAIEAPELTYAVTVFSSSDGQTRARLRQAEAALETFLASPADA